MNADQLIQQYGAGAITEREFLEGVWEKNVLWSRPTQIHDHGVYLGWHVGVGPYIKAPFDTAYEETHKAAAAFTLARLEEIRQVKEEIRLLEFLWGFTDRQAWRESYGEAIQASTIRRMCRYSRILAREQSALAELVRGIKTDALA
jgi:hypothetical protein